VPTSWFAHCTLTSTVRADDAAEIFRQGAELYARGNYRSALASFERALTLSGKAPLLYNIARCHDRLGEPALAVAALERLLRINPGMDDAAQVEAWLADLRARASLLVAVAPAQAPIVATRTRFGYPATAALAAIAGAAWIGVLGSGLVARHEADLVAAECPARMCPEAASGALGDARRLASTTDGLLGVAAVLSAATVVAVIVESRRARKRASTFAMVRW